MMQEPQKTPDTELPAQAAQQLSRKGAQEKDRARVRQHLTMPTPGPALPALVAAGNEQRFAPSAGFSMCRPQCPWASRCPLLQAQKDEYGDLAWEHMPRTQCALERQLFSQWATDLATELDVQPQDVVDLGQIKDVAWTMLEEWRAQQEAADSPMMIQSLKAFTPEGDPLEEPKLHPVYALKDKLAARKQKLLEALMTTRQAKARDKREQHEDVNSTLLRMTELAGALRGYGKERPVIDPDPRGFMGKTAAEELRELGEDKE